MATKTKQATGRIPKQATGSAEGLLSELPVDRLKEEVIGLGKALAKRGVAKLGESLSGATGKLGDLGDAVPGPGDMVKAAAVAPVKGAASKVKDALPGMGSDDSDDSGDSDDSADSGGKGKVASMDSTNLKVTNIVETIDVPVSRETAYDLWTQFEAFPAFMKKVESVQQKKPEEITWKAQVFWSHRTWTAKIVDQVPPEHIVWKSEGDKGHVDGAVTFHELAPDLTRLLVSLEYFPQGLFERTGNLWRAQGRRVRLELKHFRRFVANHALLQQDEVDGWEGEIHDGKVKRQRSSSSARKSSSSGSTAKKSTSGSTARKSTSGSTARKSTSGSTARKSASSGSTARKSTSGSSARKSSSSGSTARKSTSGSTARKSASSGSTAKKSSSRPAAKKSSSGSSGARKTTAKKSASKRTAAAAKRSSATTARASTASGGRSGSRGSSGTKSGRSSGSSRTSRSKS